MRFARGRQTCTVRRVRAAGATEETSTGTNPARTKGDRARVAKLALTLVLAAEFGVLDVVVRFDAYRVLPSLWLDALGSFVLWLFLLLVVEGRPARAALLFVHSFAFSPKEDVLVFEADRGGDELPRLYATDSKGSAPRELVPELPAGRRSQFVEWAKDGKTFLYLSNGRDERCCWSTTRRCCSTYCSACWRRSVTP